MSCGQLQFTRIQIRRDLAIDWFDTNPVLASGELGYEVDTGKLKIGDGITLWNDLAYFDDQVTVYSDITGAPTLLSEFTNDVGYITLSDLPDPYVLPTATDVRLGGIKVGANLTVEEDGTLNAEQSNYELLTATDVRLGGIKVGANLTYELDGTLNAEQGNYVLPAADTDTLGGVKIDGTTITIDGDGVISANDPNLWGNLLVDGTDLQTVSGTVLGADVVLNPNGGSVQVPSLKVGPSGNIINANLYIEAYITSYQLVSIVANSEGPGDDLMTGTYGNINGVPAPWTVFELAPGISGVPVSSIAIDDILTGTGIVPSIVEDRGLAGLGDPTEWNSYVIVNLDLAGLGQVLPLTGAIFDLTRPLNKSNFNIQTETGTDIFLDSQGLGDVIVNTNILPVSTNISSLGAPTKRWKSIYLGPGTIYVFDETLGKDLSIGARDGLLYVQNGTGLTVGEFTLIDNQLKIADPTRDMVIGQLGATADVVFNRSLKVQNNSEFSTFQVTRSGRVRINTPNIPGNDPGSLLIVASTDGSYQPVNNAGGLLHLVGPDAGTGSAARINIESYGSNANFAPFINTRRARGTAASPSGVLANDVLFRLAATGWATTNYNDALLGFTFPGIDILASDTFTHTAMGATINMYAVPDGTTARVLAGTFDGNGLTFGSSTGITFSNNDRLTYFPTPEGNTNKWLKSNGTTMSWQTLPVLENPVVYRGAWNAFTNSPELSTTLPAGLVSGWEYSISETGTQNIGSGSTTYEQGGFVIFNSSEWEYLPPLSGVASIKFDGGAVQTGAVQVTSSDITSTLDNSSIENVKLANSSITVSAGTGLSGGGTVSLGNSVTLSNAGVTSITTNTGLSTNASAAGAVTITNTGVITVTGTNHISASVISGAVTVTSDATTSATNNTIALRDSVGGLEAKDFTATLDASISSDHGPFNYGTLSYADTGIMADFSYSTQYYNQIVLQNRYIGAAASTNYIVSNDQGTTDEWYGEFGMNSSGFAFTGNSLTIPNAVYLNSISSDLVLGGAHIHFTIGDSITDALEIDETGTATFTNQITGSISGSANNVRHSVTFNTTGGATPNTAFDGNSAITVDYHTIGAQVAGTYVTGIGSSTLTIAGTSTVPTVNLTSGIVTSGTAGSSTLIPVVTVDTYGRVTGITTAANPQGTVTSVSASGSVSGLTLSTGVNPITTSGTVSLSGSISGLTNSNLSGTAGISNANLANSTIVVNDSTLTLGDTSNTITAVNPHALTISSPLSGTSYNGSAATTIALASGYGDTQNPYASKTAKYVLAAPNGLAGAPTFRALVASDIPTLNQDTTGQAGNVAYALTIGTTLSGTSSTYNGSAANTINLASGIVTAGTTGSSTLIPVVTVDTYGRVTGITTAANPQGTVTSVATSGSVNGITLTGGTITSSGTITLGGTLSGIANNQLTNSTISGVALGGSLSAVTFNNAGTGDISGTTYNGSTIKTISYNTIGAYAATNPSGYTSNTGTVTSVATSGSVNGITLTGGTITTTGTVTLGGTLSGIANNQLTNSTISGVALGGSLSNLTAGTAISFSSGTTYNGSAAITINNAGVTALTTSTGLSVNTNATGSVTVTNTDLGSSQAIFKNIAVAGQTTVTATVNNDTATFVAGTGVSITTSGKNVTFTNTSTSEARLAYTIPTSFSIGLTKNTQYSIFGLTQGVTLASDTVYQYEAVWNVQRSTSGNFLYNLKLGSGVVLARHDYTVQANSTTTLVTPLSAGITMVSNNLASGFNTPVIVASLGDNFIHFIAWGTIDVTTGGNVDFMCQLSANQTTFNNLSGGYIKLLPLGSTGKLGTWS